MCLIHFRLAVYYWSSVTARPSPWPLPQMQGIHFPFGDNKTDAPSVSDLVDLIQFGMHVDYALSWLYTKIN